MAIALQGPLTSYTHTQPVPISGAASVEGDCGSQGQAQLRANQPGNARISISHSFPSQQKHPGLWERASHVCDVHNCVGYASVDTGI